MHVKSGNHDNIDNSNHGNLPVDFQCQGPTFAFKGGALGQEAGSLEQGHVPMRRPCPHGVDLHGMFLFCVGLTRNAIQFFFEERPCPIWALGSSRHMSFNQSNSKARDATKGIQAYIISVTRMCAHARTHTHKQKIK